MERLKKVGKIVPKHSKEISSSRIGIGFEKLDRNVFDPEKAYDKVAELGVKWVRLQSGWERTEKEKGKYDFEWLDKVVDNLISRGLVPWMCLCYGNALYDAAAAKVFGAVGCPPIHTEEQKAAWAGYVKALAEHFSGRITYYEVWNEPDGIWCWKHGPSAKEYGQFVAATAKAVKSADKDAKIIGGSQCLPSTHYMDTVLSESADCIDAITFHEYTHDEQKVFSRVASLRALCDMHNPKIEIIQGESGSQSRSDGAGALARGAWTPRRQAKQLLRHSVADLMTEVKFMSYFSCMDMIEALNGDRNNKSSYLDYGYFGVLGAEFDENGFSTGEYAPKPSYYALQNLCSVFDSDAERTTLPINFRMEHSDRIFADDLEEKHITYGGFKKPNGSSALFFWSPTNLMTTEFESTITIETAGLKGEVRLVDLMSGEIYELPENMLEDKGNNQLILRHLPIKDYPMALTFGDFIK